jgi:type IV pilus assembly protein PilA
MKGIPHQDRGLTLVELLATVSIIGILSAVAVPNFIGQISRTKRSEAVATLTQFQQKLASYVDEYKTIPSSWRSLSDYSLIMTSTGPASVTSFLSPSLIQLPGENYNVIAFRNGTDLYTFHAIPANTKANSEGYNVMACIDLQNGATDLKEGPITRSNATQDPSVSTTDLVCRACMQTNSCT